MGFRGFRSAESIPADSLPRRPSGSVHLRRVGLKYPPREALPGLRRARIQLRDRARKSNALVLYV